MIKKKLLAAFVAATLPALAPAVAWAHHEALFGPQSSLAVESRGFVSLQTHVHAYGLGSAQASETTSIVSGGFTPFGDVPLGFALIQPFTYQTSRAPTPPGTTGPFSACDGCVAMENTLLSAQYRFDFTSLQRAWDRDGNFALVSAAVEPPTGNKDYAPLRGPVNGIGAVMAGLERGAWSVVALGYFRLNTPDSTSSKKGDNFLLALGAAYTPIDGPNGMLSFQLGLGEEAHFRDVDHGAQVDASGGSELLVSPTIVGSPMAHLRVFALVSLPVAQSFRSDAQTDRWRAGVGIIYSFDRAIERVPPAFAPAEPSR